MKDARLRDLRIELVHECQRVRRQMSELEYQLTRLVVRLEETGPDERAQRQYVECCSLEYAALGHCDTTSRVGDLYPSLDAAHERATLNTLAHRRDTWQDAPVEADATPQNETKSEPR